MAEAVRSAELILLQIYRVTDGADHPKLSSAWSAELLQDSQGYSEKPCLEKQSKQTKIRISIHISNLGLSQHMLRLVTD